MTTTEMADQEAERPGFDYLHQQYRAARAEALDRSNGLCQFCGQRPATEAHHWAMDYPAEEETIAGDLTALCNVCHTTATTIRRLRGVGWDHWQRFIQLANALERIQAYQFDGGFAVPIARDIAQLAQHRRGDLAELRRMDPDEPDAAAFWRVMAQYSLLNSNEEVERKWGLIIHGIALMTPTNSGEGNSATAHNGSLPVGRALYLGGESQRGTGFYSEARLNRLLTSGGPMLRTLLARMFRMLAAGGVTFNWREMAQFILNEGYDHDAAEQNRRRIAREYYRAERSSNRSSSDSE